MKPAASPIFAPRMNEPEHPHFVLSDGQYCHVLKEGLVVSKKKLPQETPEQNDNLDFTTAGLLGAGIIILSFLVTMCAITGMWVVVFLLGMLDIMMIVALLRMAGFTQTNFIPRDDISGAEYTRRNLGYDWIIVHYTGKNGKHLKRRFVIYDSKECLDMALRVMKSEGFLQQ